MARDIQDIEEFAPFMSEPYRNSATDIVLPAQSDDPAIVVYEGDRDQCNYPSVLAPTDKNLAVITPDGRQFIIDVARSRNSRFIPDHLFRCFLGQIYPVKLLDERGRDHAVYKALYVQNAPVPGDPIPWHQVYGRWYQDSFATPHVVMKKISTPQPHEHNERYIEASLSGRDVVFLRSVWSRTFMEHGFNLVRTLAASDTTLVEEHIVGRELGEIYDMLGEKTHPILVDELRFTMKILLMVLQEDLHRHTTEVFAQTQYSDAKPLYHDETSYRRRKSPEQISLVHDYIQRLPYPKTRRNKETKKYETSLKDGSSTTRDRNWMVDMRYFDEEGIIAAMKSFQTVSMGSHLEAVRLMQRCMVCVDPFAVHLFRHALQMKQEEKRVKKKVA